MKHIPLTVKCMHPLGILLVTRAILNGFISFKPLLHNTELRVTYM